MICTPGGETRALPPSAPVALAARFSAFSASCLFLFLVLLAVPLTFLFFFFLLSSQGKERGKETPRNYSTTLGASSAVARAAQPSLAICQSGPGSTDRSFAFLRFFEVKLTRPLPLPTVMSPPLCPSLFLFPVSKLCEPRFAPARPTDPENRRRPCEILSVEIDARSPIIRSTDIDRSRWAAVSN